MFKWLRGSRKPAFQVFVQEGDRQIDLYPIAQEVLAHAPEPCGMDALRLAELARHSFNGGYIRVGEYPDHIDREYAKLVVNRVNFWARWLRKAENFEESRFFDSYVVRVDQDACPRMQALSGRIIGKSQITRLPLDDCWRHCHCWYSIHRP